MGSAPFLMMRGQPVGSPRDADYVGISDCVMRGCITAHSRRNVGSDRGLAVRRLTAAHCSNNVFQIEAVDPCQCDKLRSHDQNLVPTRHRIPCGRPKGPEIRGAPPWGSRPASPRPVSRRNPHLALAGSVVKNPGRAPSSCWAAFKSGLILGSASSRWQVLARSLSGPPS